MSLFYGTRFRRAGTTSDPFSNGHVINPGSSHGNGVEYRPSGVRGNGVENKPAGSSHSGNGFEHRPNSITKANGVERRPGDTDIRVARDYSRRNSAESHSVSRASTWAGHPSARALGDPAARSTPRFPGGDGGEYDLNTLSNTDVGNLSLFDPDIHNIPFKGAKGKHEKYTRPKSVNLHNRPKRSTLSRNPSYESSLADTCNMIGMTEPDISVRLEEEILKRNMNSLVTFTPKTSGRKEFFSLSRV